ncbi:MAG: hypothetical protein IH888_11365 [Planctomycetes bacterium]|nr:hypothetical protein [Planctomycetota bacterium]
MDEHSDGTKRFLLLILVVAVIAGAWYFMRQSGAIEAIDKTVDVFVPDAEEFNRRMDSIDQAQQVTDLINGRQTFVNGQTD